MNTAPPPKKIGCRSCEVDVVIRPEKAFEFPILAEKPVSISWRLFFLEITCFWAEKAFEFPVLNEISVSILRRNRPKSDKPRDSDSRTMKVVCSFLTLSKKPPPFSNPGYAPEHWPCNFLCHRRIEKRDGGPFSILNPVSSRSLNIRLCFNKPERTLCPLLKSNHLLRAYLTHSIKHKKIISEKQNFIWNKNFKQHWLK